MANGNSRVFADRFYSQTGANFLSALASIERMHRDKRQQDDSFRQALALQDRRFEGEQRLQQDRITSQETLAENRIQHELGLQSINHLRDLNKEVSVRLNASQEQLKGLAYSSDTLSKLPYYNKTKDGGDLLKALSSQINDYKSTLNEGGMEISDVLDATEGYNEILNTRLDMANRNVQLAQDINLYLDTQAPEWYNKFKSLNPSSSISEAIRHQANMTVESGEYEELRKELSKKGSQLEGMDDSLWSKIVSSVQVVQNKEVAKLIQINELRSSIAADNDAIFANKLDDIDGEILSNQQSVAHMTSMIATHLPAMKFEDAATAVEQIDRVFSDLTGVVTKIHQEHGKVTVFGKSLLDSAQEISNVTVANEQEASRVVRRITGQLAQAFQQKDIASDADLQIASAVFATIKAHGILSSFTSEDELINISDADLKINALNNNISLLLETRAQMYQDKKAAGEIPLDFLDKKPGAGTTKVETPNVGDNTTENPVTTGNITESIDNLYNQIDPAYHKSFNLDIAKDFNVVNNVMDYKNPFDINTTFPPFTFPSDEVNLPANDLSGGQSFASPVVMPEFLSAEWEFIGYSEPTKIAGHEFNSTPLMFRSKHTGEVTHNPSFSGQTTMDFAQIGEFKDYKDRLTAIYDAQASLRGLQSELTSVKNKKSRFNKNVVNKKGMYYKDKITAFDEEISRLTRLIQNK